MILVQKIRNILTQKVSPKERRDVFDKILTEERDKIENLEDVFETIHCIQVMANEVKPRINEDEIFQFIRSIKLDIPKEEIWEILEKEEKNWHFDKKYHFNETGEKKDKKIHLSILILLALQGFGSFSKRILNDCRDVKLGFFESYTTFESFTGEGRYLHFYGKPAIVTVFEDSIEIPTLTHFLFKVGEYILKKIPTMDRKSEINDYIISKIAELYQGIPRKISEKEMISLLEKDKNSDIANIIKEHYKYDLEKKEYRMDIEEEVSDVDLQKLHKVTQKFFFQKEIDQFLKDHPISFYSQVKNMFDGGSAEDEKIRDFIAANLNKFSYEEMLQKIVHTYVSDTIHFAVYIATLLVGPEKLLEDIKENYEKGNIKFNELSYLAYALQSMSFYLGVHANPILHKGLHAYVKEQAAARSKKWWQFWKKSHINP